MLVEPVEGNATQPFVSCRECRRVRVPFCHWSVSVVMGTEAGGLRTRTGLVVRFAGVLGSLPQGAGGVSEKGGVLMSASCPRACCVLRFCVLGLDAFVRVVHGGNS